MRNTPARLWILPAKEAPVALVIRRKPTKFWQFFRWDLEGDIVTCGGWVEGIFCPLDCDVSWKGSYWIYHAFENCGVPPIASLDPMITWGASLLGCP